MIVSLVTGLSVLLSLALVTIALCSAPVWELGGAPAEAFLRALRRLAEAAPKLYIAPPLFGPGKQVNNGGVHAVYGRVASAPRAGP